MAKVQKCFSSTGRYIRSGREGNRVVVQISDGENGSGDRMWVHLSPESANDLAFRLQRLATIRKDDIGSSIPGLAN